MTQAANLQRVSDNIAHEVLFFCQYILRHNGGQFVASTLLTHVRTMIGNVAPDSPSRILRKLRRQGRVDYVVVSRAASLYRVVGVRP
jgi:hypothetical protein